MSLETAARCIMFHFVFEVRPDQKPAARSGDRRKRPIYEEYRMDVSRLPSFEVGMQVFVQQFINGFVGPLPENDWEDDSDSSDLEHASKRSRLEDSSDSCSDYERSPSPCSSSWTDSESIEEFATEVLELLDFDLTPPLPQQQCDVDAEFNPDDGVFLLQMDALSVIQSEQFSERTY